MSVAFVHFASKYEFANDDGELVSGCQILYMLDEFNDSEDQIGYASFPQKQNGSHELFELVRANGPGLYDLREESRMVKNSRNGQYERKLIVTGGEFLASVEIPFSAVAA